MCRKLRIVIEVDGITHIGEEAIKKDKRKEEEFKKMGYEVLRFSHNEIMNNINGVRDNILEWIKQDR